MGSWFWVSGLRPENAYRENKKRYFLGIPGKIKHRTDKEKDLTQIIAAHSNISPETGI
jgi:hypothetical protein